MVKILKLNMMSYPGFPHLHSYIFPLVPIFQKIIISLCQKCKSFILQIMSNINQNFPEMLYQIVYKGQRN